MPSRETLLVNYWYWNSVGHAVEGMRYALGYKAADPELRVSLLLNSATAVELARLCPFIDDVYAVRFPAVPFAATGLYEAPTGLPWRRGFLRVRNHMRWRRHVRRTDPQEAFAGVPRTWTWLVEHNEATDPVWASSTLREFYDAAHSYFEPRHPLGVAGREPPSYAPHQRLRLDLPPHVRAAATATIGSAGRAISVLLAGSAPERHLYPSLSSWELILEALSERYPDAAILLIGKTAQDGRTTTRIGRAELDTLLAAVPASVDCFDRPLLEQVALVEASDLLVSPHTGFSFVASTVGTPWLAISGGRWHEYFFNGEPFYSLLPDPRSYPTPVAEGPLPVIEADEDGEGPRTPSMSIARIREDLPELLQASELLIEKRLPYEQALADYFPRLFALYGGDPRRVFTFDDIGRRYLQRDGS